MQVSPWLAGIRDDDYWVKCDADAAPLQHLDLDLNPETPLNTHGALKKGVENKFFNLPIP
jgi:hypothetical protein